MSNRNGTSGKHNTMKTTAMFHLTTWLHAHKVEAEKSRWTIYDAASHASDALNMEVTTANIRTANKVADITFARKKSEYGKGRARKNSLRAQLKIVAGHLADLICELRGNDKVPRSLHAIALGEFNCED